MEKINLYPKVKYGFHCMIFVKIKFEEQPYDVEISRTTSHQNQSRTMVSTDRNSFTPLSMTVAELMVVKLIPAQQC